MRVFAKVTTNKITHGGAVNGHRTPEYRAWAAIKERCYNQHNKDYPRYGGRGITVHAGWVNNYSAFLAYLGQRPSSLYSVDRYPNNDGNYEPGNVRWATRAMQASGRRSTILTADQAMEIFTSNEPACELADRLGVPRTSISLIRSKRLWAEATRGLSQPAYRDARGNKTRSYNG